MDTHIEPIIFTSQEQRFLAQESNLPSQFLPESQPAQSESERAIREDISGANVTSHIDELPQADEMDLNAFGNKSSKRVARRGPMDEMRQLVRYVAVDIRY
jgi:hypothetical protein